MSANPAVERPARTRGEIWEGVAFTFCRAGTIVLLAQVLLGERWVLPTVAIGTAMFYGVALAYGKRDTRCILRLPWLIILFWGAIGAAALWLIARELPWPALVR
jgi:hypothetical protein